MGKRKIFDMGQNIGKFEPMQIVASISIPEQPKTYGPVRRGERVFYRNYRRPIKTPTAMSATDLLCLAIKVANDRLERQLGMTEYMLGVS
jgi:hypothetical protein